MYEARRHRLVERLIRRLRVDCQGFLRLERQQFTAAGSAVYSLFEIIELRPALDRGTSALSSAEFTVCSRNAPLPMWGARRLRTEIALLSAPQ